MDITKNNTIGDNVVTACNCKLDELNHKYFTHRLLVKMSHTSLNSDNYQIAELIQNHFDDIDNDYRNNDVYRIADSWIDSDGESGGGYDYIINDLEFYKCEIVDSEMLVIYRAKLSDRAAWSA